MKNHLETCPKCNSHITITRYDCPVCETRIEGEFTGCSFCRLSDEDRMFALIFIQTEGNMKDVERVLNISYPTIKSRLARINNLLSSGSSEISIAAKIGRNSPRLREIDKKAILDRLSAGKIDAKTASALLRGEQVDEDEKDSQDLVDVSDS